MIASSKLAAGDAGPAAPTSPGAPALLREIRLWAVNTLALVVAAAGLFWFQPALLSGPFDGVFTYLNAAMTARWQPAGSPLGGWYPLEGMGSRLMPIVPALLPHTYSFWLLDDPVLRVGLTYLLLTAMLALGALAYYRAAGLSCGLAVPAVWLHAVLALTLSDLARSVWDVLYGQAGLTVALAVFLQIGRRGRTSSVAWLAGFALFAVLFLLADHVFVGYLVGPPLAVALLVHLLAARSRAEQLWKAGALAAALGGVLALGIPSWMLALTAAISRTVFFDELIAQPRHAYTAGFLFRETDAYTIVSVLAVVGIVRELLLGDRQRRVLAAIPAVLSGGLACAGVAYLVTDLQWRGPAPVYYDTVVLPWQALMALRGLDYATTWSPRRLSQARTERLAFVLAAGAVCVVVGLKLAFGAATLVTVLLLLVVLGLARGLPWLSRRMGASRGWPAGRAATASTMALYACTILLVLFNGPMVSFGRLLTGEYRETHSIQQLFAAAPPFARTLQDRIGVAPESRFRGYADMVVLEKQLPLTVPLEILSWHARDIPTLSQYTYYLTPAYHAFVTRLLDNSGDYPNVNHMAIARVDVRLMRMLGLRYLMARGELDQPGLTRVDRQGNYRLYELADPNLASFSPTRVQRLPDARALLARLADPSFDPRLDVVVGDETTASENGLDGAGSGTASSLVPATDTSLTFVPGGFRFNGRSAGRSLVLLPVQYSRCLELRTTRGVAESVRAVRANLVETGLLFAGEVEVEGRFHFGGPADRCVREDVADVDRLRLRDLVERRRVPEYSLPGPRLPVARWLGLD